MKKPYRLKHKPSGLYFKPGQYSGLHPTGKVYLTNGNVLTALNVKEQDLRVYVSSKYEKYFTGSDKDAFTPYGAKLVTKYEDWEKEYIESVISAHSEDINTFLDKNPDYEAVTVIKPKEQRLGQHIMNQNRTKWDQGFDDKGNLLRSYWDIWEQDTDAINTKTMELN